MEERHGLNPGQFMQELFFCARYVPGAHVQLSLEEVDAHDGKDEEEEESTDESSGEGG